MKPILLINHLIIKRLLLPLTLFAMPLGFACCQQNDAPMSTMEMYFHESQGLVRSGLDSTNRFTDKVVTYVRSNYSVLDDEYFVPTMDNLTEVYRTFGIKFTWEISTVNTGFKLNTELGEYRVITFD